MIGIARNALFALVACLICFEPLAAQAPAVIDAAPATGARIEAVAARHGMVAAQEARAAPCYSPLQANACRGTSAAPSKHHTCVQGLASGAARHYSDGGANIRREARA